MYETEYGLGCDLQVVLKLAPSRKKFMEVIGGTGDINADIEKFCTTFSPLLEENHKFLVRNKIYWIIFMLEDDIVE